MEDLHLAELEPDLFHTNRTLEPYFVRTGESDHKNSLGRWSHRIDQSGAKRIGKWYQEYPV